MRGRNGRVLHFLTGCHIDSSGGMSVELIALGGDSRMNGLLRAARRAGFACRHVLTMEELKESTERTAAVVLPWPRSFAGEAVSGTAMEKEAVLRCLPPCDVLMAGGLNARDVPGADLLVDPSRDEAFLTFNAKLTAEGAIAALLGSSGAIIGKTCLITGFGRIARALAQRLIALEAFVIVCARNEGQMQLAHRMGAHPVPLAQIAAAGAQADIVINTVPARIFTGEVLAQMKPGLRFIELAGVPYGADPEQAASLCVSMEIMGGLPGKYAPEQAGEALFGVLERAMRRTQEGEAE